MSLPRKTTITRPTPGRQPRQLRHGTEILVAKGRRTAERIVEMIVEGKRQAEVAAELGLSRRHVNRVWRLAVREARAGLSPDKRARLVGYLATTYRELIDEGLTMFRAGSAGHGAVVVRAAEALAKLHGLYDAAQVDAGESPAAEILADLKARLGVLSRQQ